MPIEMRPLNIPMSPNMQSSPNLPGANPLEARVAALEAQLARLMSAVSVDPGGTVTINSTATLRMSAPLVEMNAGMVRTPGVVHCNTMIAQVVNGAAYTPGAGNLM